MSPWRRPVIRLLLLPAVVAGMLTLAAPAPVSAKSGPSPTPSPSSTTLGPLEVVPGMQSGLPPGAFGVTVLGTLGNDLYLFGSQSETTGAIKGVWRYRSGTWTKLGETRLDLGMGAGADYNQLAPYGAVEYKGNLYIGDRRGGNLYKLVLNPDGTFQDVVVAAKVGNEDVFPGPVWMGQLVLGSFGAYSTGENAGVYTYAGVTVSKRLDLTALGNAGYVTSIVTYGQELWVTGINATASLSQVWKFDKQFEPTLVYSGPENYRLVTSGKDLFAVRSIFAFPYETHYFARWDGSRFSQISPEVGPFLMIGSIGAISLNGLLLDLCYYNGIYGFTGGTMKQLVPGMPEMGAPMSVKVYGGYLWIASNQPIGLYRVKIATS